MSIAVQAEPATRPVDTVLTPVERVAIDGKFLRAGAERFLIKGVTYGTFAPDADGYQFPTLAQITEDFRLMAELGINTVRVYTPPRRDLLDAALTHGLRVMVGLPWAQHVAFLDDRKLRRQIETDLLETVRALGDHPAVLMFALGNEIPPSIVRWHGRLRVERFLRSAVPQGESDRAAEPVHLRQLSTDRVPRPLLLRPLRLQRLPASRSRTCAPTWRACSTSPDTSRCCSPRPEPTASARGRTVRRRSPPCTSARRSKRAPAARWRSPGPTSGGAAASTSTDWAFGLVDAARRPKAAAAAVARAFADAPFSQAVRATWPRVSVVVCAYNAADTLEDNLASLEALTYPDFEIILVNDGSRDRTSEIAHAHAACR